MAKKLVLAPERYDGKWTIGDAQVSGPVDLRGGQRPAGLLFQAPASLPDPGFVTFPADVAGPEVLRGRLETNHQVALTGTRLAHRFPGRTRLQAHTALVGGEVPDELLFSSVEFQVGGLTELATVRP